MDAISQNKNAVTSFIDALFTKGDLGAVDEYLAVDFVDHDPPMGGPANREGMRQAGAMFRAAFPDGTATWVSSSKRATMWSSISRRAARSRGRSSGCPHRPHRQPARDQHLAGPRRPHRRALGTPGRPRPDAPARPGPRALTGRIERRGCRVHVALTTWLWHPRHLGLMLVGRECALGADGSSARNQERAARRSGSGQAARRSGLARALKYRRFMADAIMKRQVTALIGRCYAGLGVAELRDELLRRLRRIMTVPAAFFGTVDPQTLLFSSALSEEPLQSAAPLLLDKPLFLDNEYGPGDVNKFAALAEAADPVGSLDRIFRIGQRPDSARYQDVMHPLGPGDELRSRRELVAAMLTGRPG